MFSAESAEMEPPLSGGHTMEVAEPADCRPGTPDALCNAAEQAGNAQGHLEADGLAAADSRDSLGTVDYTRNDTAGTIAESGAVNSIQPQAPQRYHGRCRSNGGPGCSDPVFCEDGDRTNAWQNPSAPKVKVSSTARRGTGASWPHFS